MKFHLSRVTLEPMLKSMAYISEQLSAPANKVAVINLKVCVHFFINCYLCLDPYYHLFVLQCTKFLFISSPSNMSFSISFLSYRIQSFPLLKY